MTEARHRLQVPEHEQAEITQGQNLKGVELALIHVIIAELVRIACVVALAEVNHALVCCQLQGTH